LYVFDATHLVLDLGSIDEGVPATDGASAGSLIDVHVPAKRWISSDAGASWTSVSLQAGSPVPAIPSGGQLAGASRDDDAPAVMGEDGVTHPILSAADLGSPEFFYGPRWAPLAAVDGAYYVYPIGATDHGSELLVSRDNGQTWQPVPRPSG